MGEFGLDPELHVTSLGASCRSIPTCRGQDRATVRNQHQTSAQPLATGRRLLLVACQASSGGD
jgi:hypothetical protein